MQQITDIKVEMKKTQELSNLAITANLPGPDLERPPVHFPSPDPSHQPIPISTNPPITPVRASPVINLTNLDVGPSHIFSQNLHSAQEGSFSHIATLPNPKKSLQKATFQTNTSYLLPKLRLLKFFSISQFLALHIFLNPLTQRSIIIRRRRKNGRPKKKWPSWI